MIAPFSFPIRALSGLTGQDFECQVATLVLAEDQGEPESPNRIHQANLTVVAQVHGAQADILNHPRDCVVGVTAWPTIEEVGGYTTE